MTFQSITKATADSIMLLTCDLPAPVLPLARVALAHITDKHLPDNIKAGLETMFSSNPLAQDDEVYQAMGDLMDIAISQDQTPQAQARVMRARDVLTEARELGHAMIAMHWTRVVVAMVAADGEAAPLLQ